MLVLFSSPFLHALNNQAVIPAGAAVYDAVEQLYQEQGRSLPSRSLPYTWQELFFYLRSVEYQQLSPAGKSAYAYILALYQEAIPEEAFRLLPGVEVNLESYWKLISSGTGWRYGYEERKPLIRVPLELALGDNFYSELELELRQSGPALGRPSLFMVNFPLDFYDYDPALFYRAYLSLGGEHWNIQLGRDKLSWGNGNSGNLLLSDYADYHDFLRLTLYWHSFKFSSVYVSLEPWLLSGEAEGGEKLFKALLAHRLEFHITSWLDLAVTEAVLFGKTYPDIRYLNPVMIFHNWFVGEWANSLATVELNWTPFAGLTLYGQFASDEIRTPMEEAQFDSKQLNAIGLLLGGKLSVPWGRGYLEFVGEGVFLNPWIYTTNHILRSYTTRRRIITDNIYYYDKPLGYYTGPDSMVVWGGMRYRRSGHYELGAELSLEEYGKNTIYTWKDLPQKTISALIVPEPHSDRIWTMEFYGNCYPFADRELGLGTAVAVVLDRGRWDLEWKNSVSASW